MSRVLLYCQVAAVLCGFGYRLHESYRVQYLPTEIHEVH